MSLAPGTPRVHFDYRGRLRSVNGSQFVYRVVLESPTCHTVWIDNAQTGYGYELHGVTNTLFSALQIIGGLVAPKRPKAWARWTLKKTELAIEGWRCQRRKLGLPTGVPDTAVSASRFPQARVTCGNPTIAGVEVA